MDEKLAHLTMVQIEELIERYYYKGEKAKNLIQEYNSLDNNQNSRRNIKK